MFGSHVLETAIGLGFVYLFLSVLASTLNESIASFLCLRARDLENALKNLLAQDAATTPTAHAAATAAGAPPIPSASSTTPAPTGINLATAVLDHPTIQNLSPLKLFGSGTTRPSYIDAKIFSSVLVDALLPGQDNQSLAALRASVNKIQNRELRSTLSPLVNGAVTDIDTARQKIENWYNEAMERLSGRYKRRAQLIIFGIGFAAAMAFNIDSIHAASTLWQDPLMRQEVASQAQTFTGQHPQLSRSVDQIQVEDLNAVYSSEKLPLGWTHDAGGFWHTWPWRVIGWLITAMAASFGAPFWFDFVNQTLGLMPDWPGQNLQPVQQGRPNDGPSNCQSGELFTFSSTKTRNNVTLKMRPPSKTSSIGLFAVARMRVTRNIAGATDSAPKLGTMGILSATPRYETSTTYTPPAR